MGIFDTYPECPGVRFKVVVGEDNYLVGDDGSIWRRRRMEIGGKVQPWGLLELLRTAIARAEGPSP